MQSFKLRHFAVAHPEDAFPSFTTIASEEIERLREHSCQSARISAATDWPICTSTGLLALLERPSELERLRSDSTLTETAVEELLRFDSPTQATFRRVAEDFALRGQQLRRGDHVLLMLGSANRDPEQFREPDKLDLGRTDNRHLAFSQGVHFCLGAALARLEGQIAIRSVLDRFGSLRLIETNHTWRPNVFLRGVEGLRVAV
jgi:cytochrome P450